MYCQRSSEGKRGVWREQPRTMNKEVPRLCAGLPDLHSASNLLCRDTQVVVKPHTAHSGLFPVF